jgi:hypothetical protein
VKQVTFNATFSAKVTWFFTIVGQQSGAVYQASGTSNGITNLVWKGSHTGLYAFRTGETVTATLSFMGSSLTQSIGNILIKKQASFNTCGVYLLNGDFERPKLVYPSSGNWANFNQPAGTIVNVEQGVYSDTSKVTTKFKYDRLGNEIHPVQGKNYYFIRGLGDGGTFVSGVAYTTGATTPVTSPDPNNVWFNVYVYGTGDMNAGLDIEIHEAELPREAYDGKLDDSWIYHLELKHTGWKLISFPYSDLAISTNPDLGGHGNKIMEPNRFREVAFVLLKKLNPNAPVEVFIDYPIFSYGGPFKPCK